MTDTLAPEQTQPPDHQSRRRLPANQQTNFATRPMTGDEYIESLRDGREIYLYGERVKDVTTHPAFRNPVRMTARLYDALHDPASTRRAHRADRHRQRRRHARRSSRTPRTRRRPRRGPRGDRRVGADDATAGWAAAPTTRPSFLGTLGANADFYDPFADNAERWYRESQEKVLYWNHAIVQPAGRPPPAAGRGRRRVHARREGDRRRPDRLAAPRSWRPGRRSPTTTSSPTTACRSRRSEFALVGTVPMDAPGMKLICRPSYTAAGRGDGQPVRLPAVEPDGRERHDPRAGQGADPVGERVHLRRRRARSTRSSRSPASSRGSPSTAAPGWR